MIPMVTCCRTTGPSVVRGGYDVDGRIGGTSSYGDDFASALGRFHHQRPGSSATPIDTRELVRPLPHTSDDFKAIARGSTRAAPLDVMVLDMDWHSGSTRTWTGWSWNRDLLPDAERLLDWLHERAQRLPQPPSR